MAINFRFLLDTNILIPLHDSMQALEPSLANFMRLCHTHGHQILYHPASITDIERDRNEARKARTLERLNQYPQLQAGPACPWNDATTSPNDACDNEILYALERDAVHALVTEDQGLHRKAQQRGLANRVYFIQVAEDWLSRLHEPAAAPLPNIQDVELHTLTEQLNTPFFNTIKADYPGFERWFREKAQEGRRAWVYSDGTQPLISALCIYTIQRDERITDGGMILSGESLKLCTFKVGESVRGRKIGELFLRAAFQYASAHRCTSIFIHAIAAQQAHLKVLLEDFGFRNVGTYGADNVYVKEHPIEPPALEMAPFDYLRRYYPHYLSGIDVRKFLVPIQPRYHRILFPDFQNPGNALPAGHPQQHVGNAIKLAYLCHTPNKQLQPGDIVLFYRSRDLKAVTTLGIVEAYTWSSSADEIARIVSRRTVYTDSQIEELARSETKVMLFRLIGHFEVPVTYQTLKRRHVVSGPIQSIIRVSDESFSRILTAAER